MNTDDDIIIVDPENIRLVAAMTTASIGAVVITLICMLYQSIVDGVWPGVYVPFLINSPFLVYAYTLPSEARVPLYKNVGLAHGLTWMAIIVWHAFITDFRYFNPTTDVERMRALSLCAAYGVIVLGLARGGVIEVLVELRSCRANIRAIRRALIGYMPLSEIHEACVREGRGPTPQEYARVLQALAHTVTEGGEAVHVEVHEYWKRRHEAFSERVAEETQSLERLMRRVTQASLAAEHSRLAAAADARVTELATKLTGEQP